VIVPREELDLDARPGTPDDLRACHDQLVAPLEALDEVTFDPRLLQAQIARPGTPLKREVDRLIDYGYGVRYQESLVPLSHAIPESAPANVALAVTQPFGGRDMVVGTCRAAWADLEALDLFEVPVPGRWPHELLGQTFGELGKFAVHPVVDALVHARRPSLRVLGDAYRVAVWHRLTAAYTRLLIEQDRFFVYEVASPRMLRFLHHAGCCPVLVEQARPSASEAAACLRSTWWRYWRPDDGPEQRPHLFYRALVNGSS
jgi:hypothetical protein